MDAKCPKARSFYRNRKARAAAGSDEQGEYRFPGLNPGRYLVQASEMQPPALFEQTYTLLSPKRGIPSLIDLSASPVFYPNALSPVQSRLVVVTAGQDTTSIDITVPSTLNVTSISGRIRNLPAGLSSCRVRLTASSAELGENFEVTATDSAGDGSRAVIPSAHATLDRAAGWHLLDGAAADGSRGA